MKEATITRRTLLKLFAAGSIAGAAKLPEDLRRKIAGYLETHRRQEGAYGWSSDITSQFTPTFGVVGSYRLLGIAVPNPQKVADFLRNTYPVPENRRTERPLWRLDFEQVQTLVWLDQPVDSFRQLAATWVKPADFTKRYELGANPVLQHQAMAVRTRHLLGLTSAESDEAWREYFLSRRRPDGTFNTTLGKDGSSGHVMNTQWAMLAAECLGMKLPSSAGLVDWVRACQLPSGGFTYAPDAKIGAVDDIAYTWSALQILGLEGKQPADTAKCAAWIESLFTDEGGFQDRPRGEPNPLATYYALDSLRLLKHELRAGSKRAPRAKRSPIPPGAKVFSAQVEAPGSGSPREAVLMAKTLGIHIWTAKNSPEGWIAEAQRFADAERVPVVFGIGNEEYGTYVNIPGHGCYSHLVDLVAPYGVDSGSQMPKKNFPYPWTEFRDTRITALRNGGGRMVWQFLENEELTRILLDEAAESHTYAAIASFHFGSNSFLHSQPYLHRWHGRLPMIGLQDSHAAESWWWGNQLAGYSSLFVATEPTWQRWLRALDDNLVMAVRHDWATEWKTHLAGGSPELRDFVMKREREWRWWDDAGKQARRPAAVLTLLRPGMPFEAGVPENGAALRIRLWQENDGRGTPGDPHAELVALSVDGRDLNPKEVTTRNDRYFLLTLEDQPGKHQAAARVRLLDSNRTVEISTSWEGKSSQA